MRTAGPIFENDEFFGADVEIVSNNKSIGNERIVGGNNTTIRTHPYIVSLRRNREHVCGASIISRTRALTAAHCIYPNGAPSQYSIMAGSTLRVGDANQQLRTMNRVLSHPRYSEAGIFNDIGILYWEQPLTLGVTVRAIRLARQNSPPPYGRNCNVTGWGRLRENGPFADILQVVTIPLVTNEVCNRAYHGQITPDKLCAGGLPQGGRDSCQTDSGGPLTVNGVQLGVVSYGDGCARPRIPGVYARVAFFNNWIRENL